MRRTLASVSTRSLWRGQRKNGRGSGRRRPEKQRRPRGFARKQKPRRPGETRRLKRPKEWQRLRRPDEGPSRKKRIRKRPRDGKRLRHQWPADSSWSCYCSIKSPHGSLRRRTLGGHQRLVGNLCRAGLQGTERGKCWRNMFIQLCQERCGV